MFCYSKDMIRERCSGLWHDVQMTIQGELQGLIEKMMMFVERRFEVWILSLSYLRCTTSEDFVDTRNKYEHAYWACIQNTSSCMYNQKHSRVEIGNTLITLSQTALDNWIYQSEGILVFTGLAMHLWNLLFPDMAPQWELHSWPLTCEKQQLSVMACILRAKNFLKIRVSH